MEKKLINQISELARKYKYTEIIENHEDYTGKPGLGVNLIKLFADLKDPHKNTWVQIYECEEMTAVAFYYYSGPSGAWDSLEQWSKDETWKNMIDCD